MRRSFFFEKGLDKLARLCYTKTIKGKGIESMEYFEIYDTCATEVADWAEFEADCLTNPWG